MYHPSLAAAPAPGFWSSFLAAALGQPGSPAQWPNMLEIIIT